MASLKIPRQEQEGQGGGQLPDEDGCQSAPAPKRADSADQGQGHQDGLGATGVPVEPQALEGHLPGGELASLSQVMAQYGAQKVRSQEEEEPRRQSAQQHTGDHQPQSVSHLSVPGSIPPGSPGQEEQAPQHRQEAEMVGHSGQGESNP